MKVIGSVYRGRDCMGDFAWMIHQSEFSNALFIFNDNEEQFWEHQTHSQSAFGCSAGGGNAIIRPFQCQTPPRAAGIPTGKQGQGYFRLTPDVQKVIDSAIKVITTLVQTGQYQSIYYSAANEQGELGTGIFQVGDDVKQYIVSQLRSSHLDGI